MKIIFSKKCLEYSQPGHPESPERVKAAYVYLKEKLEFVPPGRIEEKDILSVHSETLLESVKTGRFYDADSPNYPDIYSFAMLSTAGAVTACDIALKGDLSLSLLRPPGHHAGRNFLGGFCYFNNVAVAVARALWHVGKAAIIDFDCHHGNGTQDIFLGNEKVLYVSLHQSPLYPGTGLASDRNCLNFPLPAGTDELCYMAAFGKAMDEISKFEPDLIAISAGFDTYKHDPLAGLCLDKSTYEKIGKVIAELSKPTFAVLEGGYSADLPECIYQFLSGLCP
ncbi:MAG: histone deacetylase family protein [Candidatus Zixiibacteriota bacterium]